MELQIIYLSVLIVGSSLIFDLEILDNNYMRAFKIFLLFTFTVFSFESLWAVAGPDDIEAIISEDSARRAALAQPDNRERLCRRGNYFYHAAECGRLGIEANYCSYGRCGFDRCENPQGACARRQANLPEQPQTQPENELVGDPVETPNAETTGEPFNLSGPCGRSLFVGRPLPGVPLRSRFGMRRHPILGGMRMHHGTDYAVRSGTPILAPFSGTVRCFNAGGYGRMVEVTNDGVVARHAHLSRYRSRGGQRTTRGGNCPNRVSRGDIIGYVGTTGRSTGPHLHFEIRCGHSRGQSVDPERYIDVVTNLPIPTPRPDIEGEQEGYEREAYGDEDTVL